ncbi:MAG: hypothetical protein ABIQ47_17145 [Tepidiformaceae bacterium]
MSIPAPAHFLEAPLLFVNHATIQSNTTEDDPTGEVFLTFTAISAIVGPPSDPTIGVSNDTVVRLVMSKKMAAALRGILVRSIIDDSSGDESGTDDSQIVVQDDLADDLADEEERVDE